MSDAVLRAVVDRLQQASSALSIVQAPCRWETHAGHVSDPHAQSQPDAGWIPLEDAQRDGMQPGPAWLRSVVTIPPAAEGLELAGSAVGFSFMGVLAADCYINGELVLRERFWAASGPALLPAQSVGPAGSSYVVAVKTEVPASGIPKGLHCAPVVHVIDKHIEELGILQAQLQMAAALSAGEADDDCLQAALGALDLEALDGRDWDKFLASAAASEDTLLPFSSRAKEHRVHLIGHAHIDMNWQWDWQDTEDVILRDMRSVLGIMRDYPELTFSHSQAATYKVLLEKAPELFAEVKQRIEEGRWEVTASTWVEGDLNMAAGESLVSQHLQAIRWCEKHLGVRPTSMWEPDTFGHPGTVPQVARQVGVEQYFHMRCNPGQPEPYPAYLWEGLDGSRLFVASRPYNGTITPLTLASAVLQHRRVLGAKESFFFHGIGDHGGGPARADLDRVRRMKDRPLLPTITFSRLDRYAQAAQEEDAALPVHRGEMNFIFEGCYTTHADIKEQNRSGENGLLSAEAFGVMTKTATDTSFDRPWQLTAFNQFHDIFDGSGIPVTYADSAADAAEVQTAIREALDTAWEAVTKRTEQSNAVVAVNPLPWRRTDVVRIPSGSHRLDNPTLTTADGTIAAGQYVGDDLVFMADIPACGFRMHTIQEGDVLPVPAVQETSQGFEVDTPFYKAVILRDSGIIGSLYDKQQGRDYVAYGLDNPMTHVPSSRPDLALNAFTVQDERPHAMSSWLIDAVVREENLVNGAAVSLKSHGPVCTVINVKHTVRNSSIEQDIIFYQAIPRIDFCTTVDWREVGSRSAGVPNLKVGFAGDMGPCRAFFEVPFGVQERSANGQERPMLRFAAVQDNRSGLSILNNSKHGCDILGSRMRLSLVRSPYDPDPLPDYGLHQIQFSLLPYAGTWDQAAIPQAAAAINQPFLSRSGFASVPQPEFSLLEVTGDPQVVVSSVRTGRTPKEILIRVYDSSGAGGRAAVSFPERVVRAEIVSPLGETLGQLDTDGLGINLELEPYEIATVRVTQA